MSDERRGRTGEEASSKTGYSYEYGPGGVKMNKRFVVPAIVEEGGGPLAGLAVRLQFLGGKLRASDSLPVSLLGKEIEKFGIGSWNAQNYRIEPADDLDFEAIEAAGGSVDRGFAGAWYNVRLPDEGRDARGTSDS